MSSNNLRPWRNIYRRSSRKIHVGALPVGGDSPISVQTMTNTLTTDVSKTVKQIQEAANAGADIVRVSVPDQNSSQALKTIVRESPVPIVADIHFHYKRAIESAVAGAACLRINPGNIGDKKKIKDWQIDKEEFNKIFKKSSVKRTKYEGLMRNIDLVEN